MSLVRRSLIKSLSPKIPCKSRAHGAPEGVRGKRRKGLLKGRLLETCENSWVARECISNKLRMVRGGRVGGADGAGQEDGGHLCDRIAVGTTPSASARLKGRGWQMLAHLPSI